MQSCLGAILFCRHPDLWSGHTHAHTLVQANILYVSVSVQQMLTSVFNEGKAKTRWPSLSLNLFRLKCRHVDATLLQIYKYAFFIKWHISCLDEGSYRLHLQERNQVKDNNTLYRRRAGGCINVTSVLWFRVFLFSRLCCQLLCCRLIGWNDNAHQTQTAPRQKKLEDAVLRYLHSSSQSVNCLPLMCFKRSCLTC